MAIAPARVAVAITSARSAASSSAVPQPTPATGSAELDEGFQLLDRFANDAARERFERALALARSAGDRAVEAGAHRGLGLLLSQRLEYSTARIELEEALRLCEEIADRRCAAQARRGLAAIAYHLQDRDKARGLWEASLVAFEALGDIQEQAGLYYSLVFVARDNAETLVFLERGLELARRAGDRDTEGSLLHLWADFEFEHGDFTAAQEKLERAIKLYESVGPEARRALSRALTSQGRLLRASGRPERSLECYHRALKIQEEIGDRKGLIQSANAMARAYGALGREHEAIAWLEAAVALARQTESREMVEFVLGNLAYHLIASGDHARGVEILEDLLQQAPPNSTGDVKRRAALAEAYTHLGEYARAIEVVGTALNRARELGRPEDLAELLARRARALQKLGQRVEALADAREALAAVEQVRAHLVPTDFMKGGFGEEYQTLFSLTIDLFYELGRYPEALATAEQARARAFVDLLATREAGGKPEQRAALAELRQVERKLAAGATGQGKLEASVTGAVTMRGAADFAALRERWESADVELRSLVSAPPLSATELAAAAARLRSTLVSYWVNSEATSIWVVGADGGVRMARVPVKSERLGRLVREVWAGAGDRQPLRAPDTSSEVVAVTAKARPADSLALASVEAGAASTAALPTARAGAIEWPAPPVEELDGDSVETQGWAPRMRGGDLVGLAQVRSTAARELYQLLIEPIEGWLPSADGSLLTVVPHGSLFQLSFAALEDGRGRYLIEKFALHYAPAGAALQFTRRRGQASSMESERYLLVADPSGLPPLPSGKALPPLPGSRREVAAVAAQVRPSAVTILTGADAAEDHVRSLAGGQTILHLATHGVVRDDDPLASFLALGARPSPTDWADGAASSKAKRVGQDPARDGRLTAEEIYALDLQADLVVLSACRSAMGKVSGDGIIGLTRAFFYAGTPSIVATLWDVADEPASLLLPEFYRSLRQLGDKSRALRTAQLHLLRELRAGRVKVPTARGEVVLPEHPAFWASFILVGEP